MVSSQYLAQKRWREKYPEKARANAIGWQKVNPEKSYAAKKRWQAKNPELHRQHQFEYRLKHYFKMTVEDYNHFLSKQKGGCGICGREPSPDRRLAVDHDHKTGKVRGLLCDMHNQALGKFNDDPKLLWNAIKYLRGLVKGSV